MDTFAYHTQFWYLQIVLKSEAITRAGPALGTRLCFSQQGMKSYPVLGPFLDQALCSLNLLFVAGAHGPKPVELQMGTFSAVFFASIVIANYESFRPDHRRSNAFAGTLARASSAFLLAGQRITAGFTTPMQRFYTEWSTSSGLAATKARKNTDEEKLRALLPESKYIWTTLFAMLGFVVPTLYLKLDQFSYFSLALWHPFPLYIWALNRILPPILASIPSTRAVATTLLTLLVITVSGVTHYELLRDTVFGAYDLRDVFLLRPQKDTRSLAFGAHLLFQVDFLAVLITCLAIVLVGPRSTLGAFVAKFVQFAVISAIAGPGAGLIVVWALGEFGLQRAYASALKAKKAQ